MNAEDPMSKDEFADRVGHDTKKIFQNVAGAALMVALCFIANLLAACAPSNPSILTPLPPANAVNASTFVKRAVLAENTTGADYEPVNPTTVFAPDQQKFFLVVSVEGAPKGSVVKAVWYAVDVGNAAPPNYKLQEKQNSAEGSGNVVFTLFATTPPWPEGAYRVEVYANAQLAQTIAFAVRRPAGASVVTDAILAKGVRDNSLEPISPTTSFAPSDKVLHLIVQIRDAPDATQFLVVWMFGTQELARATIQSQGTRNLDFYYDRGANELAPGNYHADVYVNASLERTVTFNVEP